MVLFDQEVIDVVLDHDGEVVLDQVELLSVQSLPGWVTVTVLVTG